mmetsp:Transcript_33781/g.39744  ORF Transcript_33781/g.39744 Transcript_33781/m.39744 type:complete len:83 (+) Transcript_33781:551-799(+)
MVPIHHHIRLAVVVIWIIIFEGQLMVEMILAHPEGVMEFFLLPATRVGCREELNAAPRALRQTVLLATAHLLRLIRLIALID